MPTDITKGIEPFEALTDFSRNNPDRKPWGKGQDTGALHLGNEYDMIDSPPDTPPVVPPVVTPPATEKKFTHKLANGTVLEASTVEELATLIEKSLVQTPPPPVDFEDKPLYKPYEFKPKELTLAEQAEILNVWKENPQKAMRMLQEADLGAPANVIIQKLQETQTVLRMKLEEDAGAVFMGENEDYMPTVHNGKKLCAYLNEKGKPITAVNLGVALRQLVAAGDKGLLRKPDAPPVETTPPPPDNTEEIKGPPTHVPANQGLPERAAPNSVDAAAFAKLNLDQQKKFFSDLRRRG
jgi:hypothetical protein